MITTINQEFGYDAGWRDHRANRNINARPYYFMAPASELTAIIDTESVDFSGVNFAAIDKVANAVAERILSLPAKQAKGSAK